MLDDSIVMVKPTEYHVHEIINVDNKNQIGEVMLKAMEY